MIRYVVTPILLLAFAITPIMPIFSHTYSGSGCASLWDEVVDAAWDLTKKGWALAKAYLRKVNAEGIREKIAANLAYAKAGIAAKRARSKLSSKWSHFKEHCT